MTSTKTKATVILTEWRKTKAEEDPLVVIQAEGQDFAVPMPNLWPDSVFVAAKTGDLLGQAEGILGPDIYAAFVAAGGSAAMLLDIVGTHMGASVGE